jgi:hypothetical protein
MDQLLPDRAGNASHGGHRAGETVSADQLVVRPDDKDYPAQALLHGALCLSAMRQLMMRGVSLPIADSERPDAIQPISARIVLGGKLTGYQGFVPGIFEEALLSLESRSPVYLLGGFGGATEALAEALLAAPSAAKPDALREAWQRQNTRYLRDCRMPVHPTRTGIRAQDFRTPERTGRGDKQSPR